MRRLPRARASVYNRWYSWLIGNIRAVDLLSEDTADNNCWNDNNMCTVPDNRFVVHTSWACGSFSLSTQYGIEEKCKQIRSVVLARGRRYTADRNSNQFLPKRPRVRESLCKSSLHWRRKGKAWYIRECGLPASSQCRLQGKSRVSSFWWTGQLRVSLLTEGGQGRVHLMVFPEIWLNSPNEALHKRAAV